MCEAVPPVLSAIFAIRRIFFFSFSSCLLLVRLHALCDVVLFRPGGGGGDRDMDGDGDWRLSLLTFSFCFCRPLLVAGASLSEIVAEWALSSLLSN